jgi:transposase
MDRGVRRQRRDGTGCLRSRRQRRRRIDARQEALRAQLASSAQYRRLVKRRGDKKAIVAVAHGILVIAYHLLRDGASYRELGGDYFDRLNIDRLTRYHTKRLAALGYTRCPVIGGCPSDTDRAS